MGDYYLSVRKTGIFRPEWEWKILRRSKIISVSLGGKGFATESAARKQGRIALNRLLADQGVQDVTEKADRRD